MEAWTLDPAIPWPLIYDLLEREEEPCGDSKDFLARVLRGVGAIIPFDVGCGILDSTQKYVASYGHPERAVDEFNDYYRYRLDFLPQPIADAYANGSDEELLPIPWQSYARTEFVGEYCRSINLGQTLIYFLPGRDLALTMHRKIGTLSFSDTDKHALRVLNFLINQRLKLYERAEKAEAAHRAPKLGDIRARFPSLSSREAEVARLSAVGMTAQAIAADRGLSRRTIESQLLSAYGKLGVRDKKALIDRVAAIEGPTWLGDVFFPASASSH
jgi:DNA-binding CsgD family transcriptional regulator